MGKKLLSAIIAIAMTASISAPAFAMGVDRSVQTQVEQSNGVDKVACWWRNGRQFCNGGGGGWGGGAAAGLIGGLAAGAIIGGAVASSQAAQAQANANANAQQAANYNNWVSYCSGKYRSFDPQSGTYLGSDGMRHPCQ